MINFTVVHFLLETYLLKSLIEDNHSSLQNQYQRQKQQNRLSSEQRPCRPESLSLWSFQVPEQYHSCLLAHRSAASCGGLSLSGNIEPHKASYCNGTIHTQASKWLYLKLFVFKFLGAQKQHDSFIANVRRIIVIISWLV